MATELSNVGAVAIGRNEGERLDKCLRSLAPCAHVVYVDSASTDNSRELAKALGVTVVDLDLSRPFTAARARNEGFRELLRLRPKLDYVQFVDGDCEVIDTWLPRAQAALDRDPSLAVVCGRRRERHPDASIYNRLCDIEWDTPVGEADSCGGDAMMRVEAFRAVGGYDDTIIAGEEPELCLRIRRQGFRIERLAEEMTLHDAAMTEFRQWWKRSMRAGHAYAEGAHLHGSGPERHYVRETQRAWVWGGLVPALAVGGALPTAGMSLALLLGYPASVVRAAKSARERGHAPEDSLLYGVSCAVGKFAELQGALRFTMGRVTNKRSTIIEYKGPANREELSSTDR